MNARRLFLYDESRFSLILVILVLFSLAAGCILFVEKYGRADPLSLNSLAFHYTFYLFYGIAAVSLLLLFFVHTTLWVGFCIFLSFLSIMVLGYSLDDYLSIRLCVYISLQLAIGYRLAYPYDLAMLSFATVFLVGIQHIPPFFQANAIAPDVVPITAMQSVIVFLLLTVLDSIILTAKKFYENYQKNIVQIQILNSTITKLTEFTQSLQSYARMAEQQGIKRERYRISREIHDISGYMFTNIIALMDAIVSIGCNPPEKASEICLAARKQAQEGLIETRKAVHLLRRVEESQERGIRAIYRIKEIFERTTGVTVDIEAGTLPNSFGNTIDLILYRIIQEGLTNALRHGQATHVDILLFLVNQIVQVIIRDNGEGAKKIVKGIGLLGMGERIGSLGGTVQAMNAPEGGFQLTVTIPVALTEEENRDSDQNIARG